MNYEEYFKDKIHINVERYLVIMILYTNYNDYSTKFRLRLEDLKMDPAIRDIYIQWKDDVHLNTSIYKDEAIRSLSYCGNDDLYKLPIFIGQENNGKTMFYRIVSSIPQHRAQYFGPNPPWDVVKYLWGETA